MLLRQGLLQLWDKWPRCLSEKNRYWYLFRL